MAKRPKHYQTNSSFVQHLMHYAPTGAMAQMFIIDAIGKQAKKVANATPEELGEHPFISMQAWQETAKYIDNEMNEFLKR